MQKKKQKTTSIATPLVFSLFVLIRELWVYQVNLVQEFGRAFYHKLCHKFAMQHFLAKKPLALCITRLIMAVHILYKHLSQINVPIVMVVVWLTVPHYCQRAMLTDRQYVARHCHPYMAIFIWDNFFGIHTFSSGYISAHEDPLAKFLATYIVAKLATSLQ